LAWPDDGEEVAALPAVAKARVPQLAVIGRFALGLAYRAAPGYIAAQDDP
jgi:hypothetical protein